MGPADDAVDLEHADPSVRAAILGKGSTAPAASPPSVSHGSPSSGPPGSNLVVVEGLDADSFTDVTSRLVDHGVEPLDATRYVCSAVSVAKSGTCWEVYGRGGLADAANKYHGLNVRGLRVLDLRAHRADGGS